MIKHYYLSSLFRTYILHHSIYSLNFSGLLAANTLIPSTCSYARFFASTILIIS